MCVTLTSWKGVGGNMLRLYSTLCKHVSLQMVVMRNVPQTDIRTVYDTHTFPGRITGKITTTIKHPETSIIRKTVHAYA